MIRKRVTEKGKFQKVPDSRIYPKVGDALYAVLARRLSSVSDEICGVSGRSRIGKIYMLGMRISV